MAAKSSSKKKRRPRPSSSGHDNNDGGGGGSGTKKKSLSPLNSSVMAAASHIMNETNNNNDDDNMLQTQRRISSGGGGGQRSSGGKKKGSSGGKSSRNNKRREMSQSKLSEEAALTARLFGGGDGDATSAMSGGGAWMDEDDDFVESNRQDEEEGGDDDGNAGGDVLFAIDRSGEEVTEEDVQDDEDEEEEGEQESGGDGYQALDDQDSEESYDEEEESTDGGENNKASMIGAAWQDDSSDSEEDSDSDNDDDDSDAEEDDDDEWNNIDNQRAAKKQSKGVSLVNGPNRLKKLRRYRDETDPLSIKEYELRLRERYVSTASVAARTDWADVGLAQKFQKVQKQQAEGEEPAKKRKKGYIDSSEESSDDEYEEEDAATKILQSNTSLFSHSKILPPTLLDVLRTRDGNLSDPNNSVVNSCQFHPGSDEDTPLLMTAGMDKMIRFFRIDGDTTTDGNEVGKGENHSKVHGIHFPKLPITTASFLGTSGSVVLSGRRPFFYIYDAVSGSVLKTTAAQLGRQERSLEKFTTSPDGNTIAFLGNDGYVILVCGKTRRWMGDLKMNGSVRAVTFSGCGEYVLGSGSDGDVYRWHIGSRRCVERFHNEDGTITSSLALSSNNFLAVGAESGVVNLYNDAYRARSSTSRGGSSIGLSAIAERTPLKSIMNLTTSADSLRFNHDGNILAISTRRETNGLKLLHVPTATVFSNWPTSKTPLKYVWSTDFSPGSRYLAVGNDHGKCLLYRLKHYWDE